MKDRNVPYPVYPMNQGMPMMNQCMPAGPMPPMSGMPPMQNIPAIPPMPKHHDMCEQKLVSLEKRVAHLENLVGTTGSYNASNFQVM